MAKTAPSAPKRWWKSFRVGTGFALFVLTILGLVLVINFILANMWSFNKATNDFRPIDKQMKSLGADKICSDSDIGFDSGVYYISANYLVDANNSVDASVRLSAHQAGYDLKEDTVTINDLKSKPHQYKNENSYLVGQKGENNLNVSIIRQGTGSLPIYCNASKVAWGLNNSPPQGKVLVIFSDFVPN